MREVKSEKTELMSPDYDVVLIPSRPKRAMAFLNRFFLTGFFANSSEAAVATTESSKMPDRLPETQLEKR